MQTATYYTHGQGAAAYAAGLAKAPHGVLKVLANAKDCNDRAVAYANSVARDNPVLAKRLLAEADQIMAANYAKVAAQDWDYLLGNNKRSR